MRAIYNWLNHALVGAERVTALGKGRQMQTILVVDDDAHIREVVSFALQNGGYAVVEAADGREAINQFNRVQPDIIVLDIMMPELDGTEVCREIRKTSQTPIVFMSARADEIDMIIGLELGGDDYIAKPFSPRQLLARVRAVLRRTVVSELTPSNVVDKKQTRVGALSLDSECFRAFWLEREIIMTVTEFNILMVLAGRPEKVFNRDELMQKVYDNVVVSDRTIDSHIRRVRAKIVNAGGHAIETVHGLGYKLGPCN